MTGLRDSRRGSWQGTFLANFKRGSGDNAGVAGGLNDRAFYTAPVQSFYPNGFGLYNMAGNVNEWVEDTYRPLSTLDFDDMPAPFRGNKYKKLYVADSSSMDPSTRYEKDSTGRVKMADVTDAESKNRRNYQRGNVIDFLDGDSLSQSSYGYGVTTLIHTEKSKVYKGGSWNDRAYWLTPGSRRFLEEDQSLSTLGFRCAMDRMGSPEGNKRKTGQHYKTRRQKR
jgi:formylglycine-generating enzyme required for sulfatase activity